jgi:protein-S-isoprenylcysteine O-methyltransferase Ste14
MIDIVVVVGLVACWGTIVLAWIAGAIYNGIHVRRTPIRGDVGSVGIIGALIATGIVLIFARRLAPMPSVGDAWVRVLGLVVLVASTAFALWARLSLGTSWSIAPRVGGDRQLRTSGPYAVTRHPIYTGFLGMLLGTTLLAGFGEWIVLVPVGLVVFEVKIVTEERLLLTIFPEAYSEYRRRVPQLVPGLHGPHRRSP